jgi:lactoylglutathione lyase
MIKSIGHVAFDAYRFDDTLDFYTRVMGFPEMFRLKNDEGQLWIVYLKISDTVFLELFPRSGEAPQSKDGHFSHLCLEVSGIEQTVFDLEQRGAPVDADVKLGQDGNKQAWTHDPEGNRIELMEMSPNSRQRAAIEWLKGDN